MQIARFFKKTIRLVPLIWVLMACVSASNFDSRVTGFVHVSPELNSNASVYLRIELRDVSRMDVASVLLSQTEGLVEPSWPMRYQLSFDPSKLDSRMTYAMTVRVSDQDGRLLAINDITHQFSNTADRDNFDLLARPVNSLPIVIHKVSAVCEEIEYRMTIYQEFLLRYNISTKSQQIFTQARSGSGTRYEREMKAILMKGDRPPLYLDGEKTIKCRIPGNE